MYIFDKKQLFNQYTGKPEEATYVATHNIICDYLGVEVEERSIEYTPFDISGCEEWYYYEDFFIGGRRVDMTEFMHNQQSFHFANEDIVALCSLEFINGYYPTLVNPVAKEQLEKGLSERNLLPLIEDVDSFAMMMLQARIRVIQKLVRDGAEPLTFGVVFEED